MDKIKGINEKIIRKQTTDVLIFQRYEDEKDIPKDRKIAFRDHNGKPYIMRFRRYFIINEINDEDADRFISKRIYDNQNDFDRVVELLETSDDFKMFNKDYINCIIINSLTNIDNEAESSDLSDEDLFMSREEFGVFSRYVNINKRVRSVEDNSCFVKLIVKRFQKAFEKAHDQKGIKNYKFDLTIESLCDLCGIEYNNENISLFQEISSWIACIWAIWNCLKYKPEKRNKNLNPSCLFIYILNNHCYEINENVKEFEKLHWERPVSDDNLNDEVDSLNVSDRYNIRPQSINKECLTFLDTIDEVINFIKTYDTESVEDLTIVPIIYNDYLDTLLFGIINNLGYTPEIKMMSGKITSLLVKYNNVLFNITLSDTKANDTDVWISKDDFELYHTIDDTFYNGLICHGHMSTYNKQTMNIENLLPIGPKSGYFVEHVSQPLMGIDSRKAYTSDFMNIEYYPVFNYFDTWQEYDNHKIEVYTQYIVKADSQSANPILLSGTYSRCYGYKLNRINEKFIVMYYKKPSNLVPSNSRSLVKNVFNSKLPTDLKKFIVNKNLGLTEKKKNKKSLCKAFKNCNEALYYQTKFNKGQIYSIDEKETVEMEESIDPLDQGTDSPFKTRSLKEDQRHVAYFMCYKRRKLG